MSHVGCEADEPDGPVTEGGKLFAVLGAQNVNNGLP
jgi:hypothetical protein